MPTGVAIRDVRGQLFDAAERIPLRDGPNGLTGRAITAEAGCAKGVLNRHFADVDAFCAELILDRIGELEARGAALLVGPQGEVAEGAGADRSSTDRNDAGRDDMVTAVAELLADVFNGIGMAVVGLVFSRDGLCEQLRAAGVGGFPVLTDAARIIARILGVGQGRGHVAASGGGGKLGHPGGSSYVGRSGHSGHRGTPQTRRSEARSRHAGPAQLTKLPDRAVRWWSRVELCRPTSWANSKTVGSPTPLEKASPTSPRW